MSIIQWNIDGFYSHKDEFKILLSEYDPIVVCIQETKFQYNHVPKLNNYTFIVENFDSPTVAKGGVACLIKNGYSFEKVEIETRLQVVAVKIFYPIKLTICSVYLPGSQSISYDDLREVVDQLEEPFLLLGDFNGHNVMWNSNHTDHRGQTVEKLITDCNLSLFNTGEATHFSFGYRTFSSIDLSIGSPILETYFGWFVDRDLRSSDHYPVVLPILTNFTDLTIRPKWKLEAANWVLYRQKFNENLDTVFYNKQVDEAERYISNKILEAAKASIPQTSTKPRKKYVPFWSEELSDLIKNRRRLERRFESTRLLSDYLNFLRAKYKARKVMREKENSSRVEFLSSINSNNSTSSIFKNLRKINGKHKFQQITSLDTSEGLIKESKEMADYLAEHFSAASSSNSYTAEFQRHKNKIESKRLNIPEGRNEVYNEDICLEELENALKNCNGSSPGPDKIHYDMLKQLDSSGKALILKFFNKMWNEKSFPKNWRSSFLIPIVKKGKDPKKAENYRPISLTNCMCKLFEKIVNKRLIWILEEKGIIDNRQSAYRKMRSPPDNLVFLESEMGEAVADKQYGLSVFGDISKAYDRVWRRGLIEKLIKIGLKGKIISFINNFVQDRSFQTLIGNTTSSVKSFENGICQGSILSVTLFLVAINSIAEKVKDPVKICIFADDVVLFMRSKSLKTLQKKMQETLDKLEVWTHKTGFTFSLTKTKAMIFTRKRKNITTPVLNFLGSRLEFVEDHVFLGMTLDSKLSWNKHLNSIKAKASNKIKVLKFLAHPKFGTDRRLMLRLHNVLVLSILDYGSQIYSSAKDNQLKILDSIHNAGIRLCTGAFRTSPTESLIVESGQIPLSLRRDKQNVCYGLKVLSMKDHPIYSKMRNPDFNFNTYQPFNLRFNLLCIKYNIAIPDYICSQRFHHSPPWSGSRISTDLQLSSYTKSSTNLQVIRTKFREIVNSTYQHFLKLYTDGSVKDNLSGCAFSAGVLNEIFRLENETSIFTCELYAILKAVQFGTTTNEPNILICSDSQSSIISLCDMYSKHPIIQNIQSAVSNSASNFVFMWVPSHVGIEENEKVDLLAKQSLDINITESDLGFLFRDKYKWVKSSILNSWENEWKTRPASNKLREFLMSTKHNWNESLLDRRDERILTRLRIGHTNFTHIHLIDKSVPPKCDCGAIMSVKHLFECSQYVIRRRKFKINDINVLASDKIDDKKKILNFIKFLNLYKKI